MAVIGYLDDILKNGSLEPRIRAGLDYLLRCEEHFTPEAKPGYATRIDLDGDALFALPQVYETKEPSEGKLEVHRRYIDLQYIVSGEERIRVTPLREGHLTVPYDDTKDIAFFALADGTDFLLKAGMVAILYPEDLHAPCLHLAKREVVRKVVVKVAI